MSDIFLTCSLRSCKLVWLIARASTQTTRERSDKRMFERAECKFGATCQATLSRNMVLGSSNPPPIFHLAPTHDGVVATCIYKHMITPHSSAGLLPGR